MSENHSPLPWLVAPLKGKYYGTHILDANGSEIFRIWDHDRDDPKGNLPSAREVEQHGTFSSDAERDEFWNEFFCDSHYESMRDYANAELIVSAVNAYKRS